VTQHFSKLIIIFLLFSCGQKTNKQLTIINATSEKQPDTDTLKTKDKGKNLFSNLSQVIADTTSTYWGNLHDNYTSILHFNNKHKDTVQVEYHGQCWYSYALKIEKNKIIVLWDDNKDCIFDIGFTKSIKGATKPAKGKPFVFLTLRHDTLFADYVQKFWVKEFNKRNSSLTVFPNYFVARRPD